MPVRRHLQVESSNIKSIGYDDERLILEVVFVNSSTVYRYPDVSVFEFAAFVNAESLGSHFAKSIKSRPFTKVEKQPSPQEELAAKKKLTTDLKKSVKQTRR